MDWRDAVFRIDSAVSDNPVFGSGFACYSEGSRTYLLTCNHVIKDIGEDNARILKQPIEVVARGDDTLDLALIAVDGLTDSPVLQLGTSGERGNPFEVYGYTWADPSDKKSGKSLARPLEGQLGMDTAFSSDSWRKVPAWDLPFDENDQFAELRDGYSGSPVWDPNSRQVIAVVSHRRGNKMGYAIAVSNLRKIYPAAEAYFQSTPIPITSDTEEDAGEYGFAEDWVIRTIDHTEQRGEVVEHFKPAATEKPDRAYFYFEATPDDWPLALADHTYIELARHLPDGDGFATELRHSGQGNHAIWKGLLEKLPGGRDQGSLQEEQQLVFDWINSRRLSVLYVVVNAERDRKRLPEMIEGACAALDALPRFQPGVRLMLFVACLKTGVKRSILQRLSSGFRQGLRITDRCCALPPLRPLNNIDIEEWLSGFTPEHERRYHKEKLRGELRALLKEQEQPYETVRSHLIEGGVLRRARR